MDKNELRIAVLKYYSDFADRTGSLEFSECTQLASTLEVTENELGNAVTYLKDKGCIDGSYSYGPNPASGVFHITTKGIDYLENPHTETKQPPSYNLTINGDVTQSQIAVGHNAKIQISNAFNNIRQLDLTEDEKEIVNEMEEITKSEHPSIDAILEKSKSLWQTHGNTIKDSLIQIVTSIITSQF